MARKIPKIDKSIRYSDVLNDINLGGRYVFFSSLLSSPEPWKSIGTSAQGMLSNITSNLTQSETGSMADSKIGLALTYLKQAASFERNKEVAFFKKYLTMYPEIQQTFGVQLSTDMNFIDFIAQINAILKGITTFKNELNTEISRINRMRAADKTARGKKYNDLTEEMKK